MIHKSASGSSGWIFCIPVVSGNKWYKLKYNLKACVDEGFLQVLTFGGAYSNHLVATAAATQQAGVRSIGIVRGLHAKEILTPTLEACIGFGMQLYFVSREDYSKKEDNRFLDYLQGKFGPSFIIPEGGDNDLGRKGAGEIGRLVPAEATHVCLPVGTGTTFSGLRNYLPADKKMVGFTAVKNGLYLKDEIATHLVPEKNRNWQLEDRFHFGGFAKKTQELTGFINRFHAITAVPLDIVYTGKMMFGISKLLFENAFPERADIIAVHTGGLQGNPTGLFST